MATDNIEPLIKNFSQLELPESLESLRPFLPTKGPRYQHAEWLCSAFDDEVWIIELDSAFTVDWRVPVGAGGELLTSESHKHLWEALRSWVIVQTHVDHTGRQIFGQGSAYNALRRVFALIDYLLLNADLLALATHGLPGLSTNDFLALIGRIGSHAENSVAIYRWPERVAHYLRAGISTLSKRTRNEVLLRTPFLANDLPPLDYRLTDLSDSEIVNARIWLWASGKYIEREREDGFQFQANTTSIASTIYTGTLVGQASVLRMPPELGINPGYRVSREKPGASVTSEVDERRSRREISRYIFCIRSLNLLSHQKLMVPSINHDSFDDLKNSLDLKETGRFRTIPHKVAMDALGAAFTFALDWGDDLITSYLNVARAAQLEKQTLKQYALKNGISQHLTKAVRDMGVLTWEIEPRGSNNAPLIVLTTSQYYTRLRENRGLFECIRVLYGAIQVAVGALTARRNGELMDLVATRCLDISGTRIIFDNRKSGIGELRDTEARPIPPVCVDLIRLLERLQQGLLDMGLIKQHTKLFSTPSPYGFTPLNSLLHAQYNASLDYFCDYIEIQCDSNGLRYYIRQHQLRRWFAMLFFWGNSFGGVETLRWFLGHTDMEHLYHYITESTPGSVLRGVAATWATQGIMQASTETEELAKLINEHFHTSNFSIIEEEKLELYILDLLEKGRVKIEPEFLDEGRTCRILVRISHEENAL